MAVKMVRECESIKKQQAVVRTDKMPHSVNADAVKTAKPKKISHKASIKTSGEYWSKSKIS